jgi:hypothetical protein
VPNYSSRLQEQRQLLKKREQMCGISFYFSFEKVFAVGPEVPGPEGGFCAPQKAKFNFISLAAAEQFIIHTSSDTTLVSLTSF